MIEQSLYAIQDTTTDAFQPPIMAENDNAAKRFMVRCVLEVPMMKNTPSDFKMFKVGTFNQHSGKIVSTNTPEFIVSAVSSLESHRLNTARNTNNEETKVSNESPVQPGTQG